MIEQLGISSIYPKLPHHGNPKQVRNITGYTGERIYFKKISISTNLKLILSLNIFYRHKYTVTIRYIHRYRWDCPLIS